MLIHLLIRLLLVMSSMLSAAQAIEVAGVRVEPRARVGATNLTLNGAGMRRMFATNVYIIGIYLPAPTRSAATAIQSPGAKRISLTLARELTAQSLVDALREGIRDNTTEAEFESLNGAINALSATMLPLRAAQKGDVLTLDYDPAAGAQVAVNGNSIGVPVPGQALYSALLKI